MTIHPAVAALYFLSAVASAPNGDETTTLSAGKPRTGYLLDRTIEIGNLSFTTHLVKSPRSIYVIGKLTYLTRKSLVEITPEDILIMSRPYGPSQRYPWMFAPDPSVGSHPILLLHDVVQRFAVVLYRRDTIKIVFETTEFVVVGKTASRRGWKSWNLGGRGVGGSGRFAFLSVQFHSIKRSAVDAIIDPRMNGAPESDSDERLPHHPHYHRYGRRRLTYLQEVKFFFMNVMRLLNYGADYLRNSAAHAHLTSLIELYRPRFSSSTSSTPS